MNSPRDCLLIVLHCPVIAVSDSNVELSEKFLEEVEQYAKFWRGTVRLMAFLDPGWSTGFGIVKRAIDSLPFELVVRSHDDLDESILTADVAVVLCGVGYRYNRMARLGRSRGVPIVYVAEWSQRTQRAITRLEARNPLVRARRLLWLRRQQQGVRDAISSAAGVQCNGTPTFVEYSELNEQRLLYFDNRVTHDLLIEPSVLEHRLSSLLARSQPLRLVFTGRLTPIKGVMDLIEVANELRRLQVEFEMTIVGDGELRSNLVAAVSRTGLEAMVTVLAPKAFRTELMPFVQHIDLFVCPHLQGDPSCTYVETLACGVPIVGYDNEALVGVATHAKSGWLTPLGEPKLLAAEIARLDRDRTQLVAASRRARDFASVNTFDHTYARRVDQLSLLAEH